MKINHQTVVRGGAWHAEFSLAEEILMRFYLGDRLLLELKPAAVNRQSEAQCLPQKARIHHHIDGLSLNYDVLNLIPFGAEPAISRDFDFSDGFVRVVEDIDAGKNAVVRELSLDAMSLPGPWSRIAVVRIPGAGKTFPKLDWIELEGENTEVIFDETYPFLAFVAETPDGRIFETGCGDDLWRWGSAADLPGCSARFRVVGGKDSIEISRDPVLFDAESGDTPEASRRTWRFKWYFAWSEPASDESEEKKPIQLDMLNFAEQPGKYPCLHAKAVRKKLRQELRGLIAANTDADIILTNAECFICNQESHLDRGTKKNFLHWDAWDLMELFVWANRKALANGSSFRFSGKFETPLLRRLARSSFQSICGE